MLTDMGKTAITKSFTIKGDIGATYDYIKKIISDLGFTENSSIWPSEIEFKRGKSSFLAKNMKDIKTTLKVFLTQASSNVNILLEYNFNIPSSFVNRDDNEIEQEIVKIKHHLSGFTNNENTLNKVCDICFNPIQSGESFCKNCGRTTFKQVGRQTSNDIDVKFDYDKISFGHKTVDDLLYGGIPENYVLLITSPTCEETNLLVTRFMETGIDQDDIVFYISNDGYESNKKLAEYEKFFQVICNSQADVRRNNTQNETKNYVKVTGVERLTELSVAITTLLNIISKDYASNDKGRRLIINNLSDILLTNQPVNTRKWLRETISKVKAHNFTFLATINPHMHAKEETQALLDLFDGQIEVYEKESNGSSKMFLRIKRMNNNRFSTKESELIKESFWINKNS